MIPGYIQAILALAIVILLFVVGFMVYNYEFLKSFRAKGITKQKVIIFDGIKDLKTTENDIYPTQDKNSSQYRDLTPSYNQQGGIEMTYNFWMYMTSAFATAPTTPLSATTDNGFTAPEHQTVLFVKGSTNLVDYSNICNNTKKDIMVKCPLVKLENYGKYLTVEFNTLQGTDAVIENAPPVCTELTNDWKTANSHKLIIEGIADPSMVGKFNMYTVVIQDTFPQDPLPYRNKSRCRIFVNGVLVFDKYVDGKVNPAAGDYSTIKTNTSNLVVAPTISVSTNSTTKKPTSENQLRLANMAYFNYAITQAEIDSLFNSGYDNKPVQVELNTPPASKGTGQTAASVIKAFSA
jgi:hypothetical protein